MDSVAAGRGRGRAKWDLCVLVNVAGRLAGSFACGIYSSSTRSAVCGDKCICKSDGEAGRKGVINKERGAAKPSPFF